MTGRPCDRCQPVVDGALDSLARATARHGAAEGNAWRATDLLTQWVELVLEEPHTPADAHLATVDRLLKTTRLFLDTAPVYAPATFSGEVPSEGEAGGTSPGKRRTLADDVADGLHDRPHP